MCYLLCGGRRWEKTGWQQSFHNVLMGAGASEGLTVEVGFDFSVWPDLFVSGWMSTLVQDNQGPQKVGRSVVLGREEAVNGTYVAKLISHLWQGRLEAGPASDETPSETLEEKGSALPVTLSGEWSSVDLGRRTKWWREKPEWHLDRSQRMCWDRQVLQMLLSGYFVVFLCFSCCSEVSLNYSGWLVLGEVRRVWFGRRVARRTQGWRCCRRWCFSWRIDEGLIPLEGKKLGVTASEGKDGMGIKKHSLLDLLRPSNLLLKDRRKNNLIRSLSLNCCLQFPEWHHFLSC